jgi:hypothetical protein
MPLQLGSDQCYQFLALLKKHGYLKGRLQQALTEALENSPDYRVWIYIRDYIGKPLPACEETIATHPFGAVSYARDVLHDRFPLGEKVIAEEVFGSYPKQYAEDVLGLPPQFSRYWQPAWCWSHSEPWGGKIWGESGIPQDKAQSAGKECYEKLIKEFPDNAKLLASLTPEA